MSDSESKKPEGDNSGPSSEKLSSQILTEGKALLGETLKKVFATGVSAAFMTEESVRTYLSDLKLPKEILNLVLQGAQKSKEEITQRVSKEVMQLLQKVDWAQELTKIAENHKLKITAEFDLVPKSKSEKPKPSED